MRMTHFASLIIVLAVMFGGQPNLAMATPLNRWKISCGVDAGAITKSRNTYTFKTSSNHCPGGTWKQRAEIATEHAPPTLKGAYQFTAVVSMISSSTQRFDIFQMHDGRRGCAPPLKLEVMSSGHLTFDADYKIGSQPGNNCIKAKSMLGQRSAVRLKRDGTEYNLAVTIDFDGKGGFRVWVAVDGTSQISASYSPPKGQGFFQSEKYYFKHGNYSPRAFPYTLTSRNVKVRKVRLSK